MTAMPFVALFVECRPPRGCCLRTDTAADRFGNHATHRSLREARIGRRLSLDTREQVSHVPRGR